MVDLQWVLTASIQMVDLNSTNSTNLSKVCPHSMTDDQHSGWVFLVFGECVTNLRQWFAFWIGMSSILFWLFAQVPQLITNCRTGKADQALSFWFLLQWFLGDATNLIGALLAHQLPTQIATAVYFVIIDTATMLQFLYYVVRNRGVKGLLDCCRIKRKPPVLAALLPGLMFTVFLVSHNRLMWRDPYQTGHRAGRTLKDLNIDLNDPEDIAGYVLGCISAIFYVMSRVPQIVKNCRRCSVEGLSPIMFVLAILGNVTYGLGIFLYSVDPVFLLQKLPWLVGSVGTLFFDFTIVTQFLISLCSKHGRRLCRNNVEDGADKEPLLNQAASESDCFSSNSGSIQTSKRVSKRNSSQSPDGLQNGYKSVQ